MNFAAGSPLHSISLPHQAANHAGRERSKADFFLHSDLAK